MVRLLAKACAFCIHEDREELEAALRARQKTQQDVADILRVDRSCVSRHMREHIGQETPANPQAIDELQAQLSELRDKVTRLEQAFKEHQAWSGHRRF